MPHSSPSPLAGDTAVRCGASPHPQRSLPPSRAKTSLPRTDRGFPPHSSPDSTKFSLFFPFIFNLIFFFPLLCNLSQRPRTGSGLMPGSERAAGPVTGSFPDGAGAGGGPGLRFRPLRCSVARAAGRLSRRGARRRLGAPPRRHPGRRCGGTARGEGGGHTSPPSPAPSPAERAPPPD